MIFADISEWEPQKKRATMFYWGEETCKRLWAAVLEKAIKDALGDNIYLRESAWTWLRSENQGIGSFLWICTILGLKPQFVRMLKANKDNGAEIFDHFQAYRAE